MELDQQAIFKISVFLQYHIVFYFPLSRENGLNFQGIYKYSLLMIALLTMYVALKIWLEGSGIIYYPNLVGIDKCRSIW
jgi:hypothetical protein